MEDKCLLTSGPWYMLLLLPLASSSTSFGSWLLCHLLWEALCLTLQPPGILDKRTVQSGLCWFLGHVFPPSAGSIGVVSLREKGLRSQDHSSSTRAESNCRGQRPGCLHSPCLASARPRPPGSSAGPGERGRPRGRQTSGAEALGSPLLLSWLPSLATTSPPGLWTKTKQ